MPYQLHMPFNNPHDWDADENNVPKTTILFQQISLPCYTIFLDGVWTTFSRYQPAVTALDLAGSDSHSQFYSYM